ncbi:unnamed protein product [Miscanthus lutarioriparius]|uniref:Uncharacterized protein n=1 Tax=Miscanthus lutarioriparius TaxID=422564 RepID=A0A811RL54_9POAL|nr:unnamed protein product [Miscanthus lutarioriparius]
MAATAAVADAETDGLPISGKQSTTTQAKKSAAERAHRAGEAVGEVAGRVLAVLLLLGLLIVGVVRWEREWSRPYDPVEYTVTIAAVSGLDPATKDLPHPAPPALLRIDPACNLTLAVASPSTAARRECVQAGTTVEVSYLRSGVPLATGPAPAFCVEVGEREEGSVVAWGDGVRLPGFVLDSLAADVLRGAPEFGVKLTPPIPYCASRPMFCSTTVDVISCWAKAGGGPAPCSVSRETVQSPFRRCHGPAGRGTTWRLIFHSQRKNSAIRASLMLARHGFSTLV